MPDLHPISALLPAELPDFFAYLNAHLAGNGADGTPLFQPLPRAQSSFPEDKALAFAQGLATPLDGPGWRRAWVARDAGGAIVGHVDLRARPERGASHRALLGMGVRHDQRRRGLGQRLIAAAIDWALAETGIDWIDLEVLADNLPARQLYRQQGFAELAAVDDMFRIDGSALAYVHMTRRIAHTGN